MISQSRVKDSLEHLQLLTERIRNDSEKPIFNANFLTLADAAESNRSVPGSLEANVSEFTSLSRSLYQMFHQAAENRPELQLKLEMVEKNWDHKFPPESYFYAIVFEVCKATIVLIPLYLWYKRGRRAKIEEYLAKVDEIVSALNGAYFEVSNNIHSTIK